MEVRHLVMSKMSRKHHGIITSRANGPWYSAFGFSNVVIKDGYSSKCRLWKLWIKAPFMCNYDSYNSAVILGNCRKIPFVCQENFDRAVDSFVVTRPTHQSHSDWLLLCQNVCTFVGDSCSNIRASLFSTQTLIDRWRVLRACSALPMRSSIAHTLVKDAFQDLCLVLELPVASSAVGGTAWGRVLDDSDSEQTPRRKTWLPSMICDISVRILLSKELKR